MIKGLHHVAVVTRDLGRLVEFYCDHFGGLVLSEFNWGADDTALAARFGLTSSAGRLSMIGFEGARLEIFEFTDPILDRSEQLRPAAKPGFAHICFEVDDALAEYTRLTPVMPFHAEPLVMPEGGIFAYGRDPDGNVVEILQLPK